jgi:hypothetical protein
MKIHHGERKETMGGTKEQWIKERKETMGGTKQWEEIVITL